MTYLEKKTVEVLKSSALHGLRRCELQLMTATGWKMENKGKFLQFWRCFPCDSAVGLFLRLLTVYSWGLQKSQRNVDGMK